MKDGAILSRESAAKTEQRSLSDAVSDALGPDLSDAAHAERLFRLAAALTGAVGGALAIAAGDDAPKVIGPNDPQLTALAIEALDDEAGERRQRDRIAKRIGEGGGAFAIALRINSGGAALAVGWERLVLLAELSRRRSADGMAGFDADLIRAASSVARGDWSAAQTLADRLRAATRSGAVILGAYEDRALARYIVSDAPALDRSGAADDMIRDRLAALGRGEVDEEGVRLGAVGDGYGLILIDARDGDAALAALSPLFALPQTRSRPIGGLRRLRAPLLAVAALLGLAALPVPDSVEAPATVTSEVQRTVTAPLSSILLDMQVAEGDVVAKGDPIAVFDTRDLDSNLSQNRAQLAASLTRLQDARRRRDEAARRDAELEMEQIQARIDQYDALRDAAILTSPVDGVVIRDHGERRIGSTFPIGEPVAEIFGLGAPMIEAWIDERDRARVAVGDAALFRSDADPDQDISATIARIATTAEQQGDFTVFRIDLTPENPPAWAPGMKGVAALDHRRASFAELAWTRVRHWLARNFWI